MRVLALLSIILVSCHTSPKYYLKTKYNDIEQNSTLFLTKNEKIIDTLSVDSYYNSGQLKYRGKNFWDYHYKPRCGSGCSYLFYMKLTHDNDKIKVIFELPVEEKYSYTGNDYVEKYTPYFSKKENYVIHKSFRNKKLISQNKLKIQYDSIRHYYYLKDSIK